MWYEWYYVAYAPMDLIIAPPISQAQLTQSSILRNCLHLISNCWTSVCDDKQTICSSIAQQELTLKELFELSDRQGEFVREIDGSDVATWPVKYNAWWRCRHTLVNIRDVSPILSLCSYILIFLQIKKDISK